MTIPTISTAEADYLFGPADVDVADGRGTVPGWWVARAVKHTPAGVAMFGTLNSVGTVIPQEGSREDWLDVPDRYLDELVAPNQGFDGCTLADTVAALVPAAGGQR